MNKEELLEMINSTINENGAGMITGKALNLALTEIVNAMGSGSGGEKLHMIMEEAQPESVAPVESSTSYEIPSFCVEHNKEVYNKLQTIWKNGEELEGIIYVDLTHFYRHNNMISPIDYLIIVPIGWGIDMLGNIHIKLSYDSTNISLYNASSARTLYLWSNGYFYDHQENGIEA